VLIGIVDQVLSVKVRLEFQKLQASLEDMFVELFLHHWEDRLK